jgi:hypothetical protein
MTLIIRRLLLRVLRLLLLSVAAAAVLALVWPAPSTVATALPREPDGSVALRPVNPQSGDGGCSSPLGATRWNFAAACELHDHRYDLLRSAASSGEPLPDQARRAADAVFADQLSARCADRRGLDGLACRVTARFYAGAVAVNSWRQQYGPPRSEPALPWLIGSAVGVLLSSSVALSLLNAPKTKTTGWRLTAGPAPAGQSGHVA